MNVLIVYSLPDQKNCRKTMKDSIFCFKKYVKNINFYFYNFILELNISAILRHFKFDAVIYHYTFFAYRFNNDKKIMNHILSSFDNAWSKSVKAAIVQDEYYAPALTREMLKRLKIEYMFTLAHGENIYKLYPKEKVIIKEFVTVLTGYVDEETIVKCKKYQERNKIIRDIDIGYRARKSSYSLGRHGHLKEKIEYEFNRELVNYNELKCDIKNTDEIKNVFMGFDWFKFMFRCRTMIGCLGGASLMDENGNLLRQVQRYLKKYPDADFEGVYEKFLVSYEGNIDYTAMGPRNYECAITKTCQILVEGFYPGMRPGVDYIELKKDFSNIKDVLAKVKDKKYCEKIAENAYENLVLSSKYTYKKYAYKVMNKILFCNHKKIKRKKRTILLDFILFIYNANFWFFN